MHCTASSCYSTLSGAITPSGYVSLVRMTDWNSTSIYITLDPRPLGKERINHSVRGRPSAGPRKPLITGSSSLQCRPLIVLSKNRCACSLRSAARLMEALSRPPSQRLSLPCCLAKTSGTNRRPPEFPACSPWLPLF